MRGCAERAPESRGLEGLRDAKKGLARPPVRPMLDEPRCDGMRRRLARYVDALH